MAIEELTRALCVGLRQDSPLRRIDLEAPVIPQPRIPCGIPAVDHLLHGGVYGFSVIAGAQKVGKTMLAVSTAVEAGLAGWEVVYWLCENQENLVRRHLHHKLRSRVIPAELLDRLHFFRFYPKQDLDSLVTETLFTVLALAPEHTERLLLIVDHLNALALYRDAQRRQGYFRALDHLIQFCQLAAEESAGNLSVLAVSEVTREGHAKGQRIEYAFSGALISLRGTGTRRIVAIDVESRETAGASLGKFERCYDRCHFERLPAGGPAPRSSEHRLADGSSTRTLQDSLSEEDPEEQPQLDLLDS